jgi:hypothetical protein
MKNLTFLFLLISVSVFAQVQPSDLPDITKVYKVTVDKKKINPTDTVKKVRLIPRYLDPKSDGSVDTLTAKGVYLDSAGIANAVIQKIVETNQAAAEATYRWFGSLSVAPGLANYNAIYKDITGQNIYAQTWSVYGSNYVGTWRLTIANANTGETVANHNLTIAADGKAKRGTGTPNYSGQLQVNSPNNIQLSNYFATNQVNVFHAIGANTFISTDGRFFLIKQ